MPALFAYLLAVSLLLGGGYVSLHWLAAPPDASTNQRPSASKGVSARNDAVKKSDPSAAAETQAEKRPNDQAGTETAASPLTSGASSKAVPQAPAKQTGESEDTNAQTKKAERTARITVVTTGLPVSIRSKAAAGEPWLCKPR